MKVILQIDRGGFGRVEEVELDDGTRVARKVFDPDDNVLKSTSLEDLKKRFRREVKSQSTLSSDYVIPILAFDLDGEEMWYTMPLCERNFQHEIQDCKANATVPLEALADIINALEDLHAIDLKHRDLNPRNILLHEGRWKLADFGLVSPLSDSSSVADSSLHGWGTFSYMAPEQSIDFKRVDARADIYAFGCILHDLFTDGQRVPLGKQSCDGPMGMVIERCTEIDPERRFKNVTTLRGVLFTVLAQQVGIQPSVESNEWATLLSDANDWESERLREFTRFVSKIKDANDLWRVFMVLDEEAFEKFFNLDPGYSEFIAIEYCSWVIATGFDFEICDVIVQRLLTILRFGNTDVKARAIMAIANLGKTHRRFYVMRQLMKVCSAAMEASLAKRIAFEIQAEDAFWWFIDSATGIDLKIDDFHPLIAEVLHKR